jgi:hypothetical protein
MIWPENQLIQTLNQVSDKPHQGFYHGCQEISGWNDQPPLNQEKKRTKIREIKSTSQKIRSETPSFLSKRLKTDSRQHSMQFKYAEKTSETEITFKDIDKSVFGIHNSLTPKLRNLINSINRAKINKMTEAFKRNQASLNINSSMRIQSISPFPKVKTPAPFISRVVNKNCGPSSRLQEFKIFVMKKLKN